MTRRSPLFSTGTMTMHRIIIGSSLFITHTAGLQQDTIATTLMLLIHCEADLIVRSLSAFSSR
jgi:hypothetical protein